ncbi:MAG: hypothetical protein HOC74_32405 [Gemmatimonadetes bacterium]|jgi:hypothetical protein|nr:hypothetical protein [Gemmatimonadota bacterium]
MEKQTFDLSGETVPAQRYLYIGMSVVHLINSSLAFQRHDYIYGTIILILGLVLLLISAVFLNAMNRYIITLDADGIHFVLGVFKKKDLPWNAVSAIHIKMLDLEIDLKDGRREEIHFGRWTYEQNQTIKPGLIDALRAATETHSIPTNQE